MPKLLYPMRDPAQLETNPTRYAEPFVRLLREKPENPGNHTHQLLLSRTVYEHLGNPPTVELETWENSDGSPRQLQIRPGYSDDRRAHWRVTGKQRRVNISKVRSSFGLQPNDKLNLVAPAILLDWQLVVVRFEQFEEWPT